MGSHESPAHSDAKEAGPLESFRRGGFQKGGLKPLCKDGGGSKGLLLKGVGGGGEREGGSFFQKHRKMN